MIDNSCYKIYHLAMLPRSSTYLKQGSAHLRMLISGSISLAMASRTIMLVSRVANSPSSFILFSRMMVSMLTKRSMPSTSSKAQLLRMLKHLVSSWQQLSNLPEIIFFPLKLDRLQIIWAQSQPLPSMTDLMKFTKFFLSRSLSWMTIPTSMRLTMISSLYFLRSYLILCYSSLLSTQSLFIFSVSKVRDFSLVYAEKKISLIKSLISVYQLYDFSLISMRMFPPWQSACTKLFFMSISKKVVDPSRAITLFRGCLSFSQQVTGTPSTKVSTKTESFVFSSNGNGKFTSYLSLNISLNLLRFRIQKVKSICSVSVRFRETSLTGNSIPGEKKEAKQLRKKRRLTSRTMYLSTLGCRTFTATFLPLYCATQTWLTEPDAMGFSQNFSKISSIFFPQASLKFFLVVQNE